jgi:hypothetical protein
MSPREKALYHQIHPLKLLTDISAEIISIYYCWQRRLRSGLVIAILPPVVASFLIMRLVGLEPYRRSAAGAYLKRCALRAGGELSPGPSAQDLGAAVAPPEAAGIPVLALVRAGTAAGT